MSNPTQQPTVKLTNGPDYRETYANSVQMRVNIWDFFLVFGTLQQQTETQVEIRNVQGIYLSPQQAKALLGLLQQNVAGYESTFGEIKLDQRVDRRGRCIKLLFSVIRLRIHPFGWLRETLRAASLRDCEIRSRGTFPTIK